MKRKKHGREEIIGKLREAEGLEATGQTLGQVCQKLEIRPVARPATLLCLEVPLDKAARSAAWPVSSSFGYCSPLSPRSVARALQARIAGIGRLGGPRGLPRGRRHSQPSPVRRAFQPAKRA